MHQLRKTIVDNLPPGFEETFKNGMVNYVVPHSRYPAGYHCDPKMALPFISIASQKNFIALHHFGIYSDKSLYDWFISAYPDHSSRKPDMGKSCIRFKKPEHIPFSLIAELMQKMSVEEYITIYESHIRK